MAGNLIKELTVDYCNQMMRGSWFLVDGEVHWFDAIINKDKVNTLKLSGNPDKVAPEPGIVSWDVFTGWSVFAYPTLGYRMAGNGQILCYISRTNSVRRGLSHRDVHVEFHDVSIACQDRLGINLQHYLDDFTKACLVMKPVYMSLTGGLKRVMSGEIPAFALSADFAVAPNDEVPFLEILYRQRRIGTISDQGTIELLTPNIKHSWDSTVSKGESQYG